MGCINTHLLPLKILLFCFYGGLGCLYPFLGLHMKYVGLETQDIFLIQLVVALVTAIGAPLAGLVVDRTGRHKSYLIMSILLTAACYSALMLVPKMQRMQERHPHIHFNCTGEGSAVVQEKCGETCFQGKESNVGQFHLTDCQYECLTDYHMSPSNDSLLDLDAKVVRRRRFHTFSNNQQQRQRSRRNFPVEDVTDDLDDVEGSGDPEEDLRHELENVYLAGVLPPTPFDVDDRAPKSPPHFCFYGDGFSDCQVFANYSEGIAFNSSLKRHIVKEDVCLFPVVSLRKNGRLYGNLKCRPLPAGCSVRCTLQNPYGQGTLFEKVNCHENHGNPLVTFWTYLTIRAVGETFAVVTAALLNAAVLSMTHEYKGDLGHELVWGTLALGTFAPAVGYLMDSSLVTVPFLGTSFALCFIGFAALLLLATMLAAIISLNPEWRTRSLGTSLSRMLCSGETAVLFLVLILLGTLHGLLDDFIPFHLMHLGASKLLLGLSLTVGMLPALLFMWKVEVVVDYCGYTNLLILSFVFYILRFTGYAFLSNPWWCLIIEVMETFTLTLMWVTASLYMYHLSPRALLATGQALVIVLHFSIGRGIGAVITWVTELTLGHVLVYQVAAGLSAFIASMYLLLYYTMVKPQCMRQSRHEDTYEAPFANGTYTPLRVYNNGQGKSRSR